MDVTWDDFDAVRHFLNTATPALLREAASELRQMDPRVFGPFIEALERLALIRERR